MRRRIPVRVVLGVLALALAVLGAGLIAPAGVQAATGQGRVTAQAGWDGKARPGRLLPVTVAISGARPGPAVVSATVTSGNGGSTVTQVATQVAADGTANATLVVSAPRDIGTFDVDVSATEGTSAIGTTKATVSPVGEEELVGVLPGLAGRSTPPATSPLTVPVGTARFVAVPLTALAFAGSLGPLGSVAASPDDLLLLDSGQQQNLASWIALGGRLLVDADSGPVPGLPDAWQPDGPTGRATAGLGEVHLTGGALGNGQWNTIEPTPTISPADPDVVAPSFTGGPVGISIAANSGLRIPALGTVLIFLLAYVLLVGPILFLILNRLHRAHWAWVLLPLLAVAFTAVGYVAGGQARDTKRTAFSASVLQTPAVNENLAYLGVLSRQGGNRSLQFPAGWWSGNVANELYGRAETDVTSRVTSRSTTATVSLVGGEFAVLGAKGATAPTRKGPAQLEVHAVGAPKQVAGTVRNRGTTTLRSVAVFVGNHATQVGDLAPGAQRAWSVSTTTAAGSDTLFVPIEAAVWPQVASQNVDTRRGAVDLALWGETTRLYGPDLRAPGSVVAVGWTDVVPTAAGIPADADGRTAIIARETIQAGAHLTGFDVRRDLLRGPATTPISDANGPTAGAVFRFVLPPGRTVDPAALRLTVPATLSRVDVWDGTRWQTVFGTNPAAPTATDTSTSIAPAGNSGFTGPSTLVSLPPGAVIDGVVYVRTAIKQNGPPNSAADLVLGEAL